jgi:hypothetical protein
MVLYLLPLFLVSVADKGLMSRTMASPPSLGTLWFDRLLRWIELFEAPTPGEMARFDKPVAAESASGGE